uniref:Neuroplastin n=1 Tax=Hucho hucho TaxID=62062 RepID=A0A4W5QB69_9TELE
MQPNAVMLAVLLFGNLMLHYVSAQNEPKINASDQIILPSETKGPPVTLQCNLTNAHEGQQESFWMKNGVEIADSRNEQKNTEYIIKKPRSDDAGEYMCVYTFETAPNANATIEVKAAPEITGHKRSDNKNEGQSALLYCKSVGYPFPIWTWRKLDGSHYMVRLLKVRGHGRQCAPHLCCHIQPGSIFGYNADESTDGAFKSTGNSEKYEVKS